MFADTDLQAYGHFERISEYSQFLPSAEQGPPGPWLYTGGLENRSELVDRLARKRPLWGNHSPVLRAARNPRTVFQLLDSAGIRCPRVWCDAGGPKSGRWLVKPLAGSGGRGIQAWTGRSDAPRRGHFLQEYVDGEACAAIYVARDDAATLLGVTRQLVGAAWLHAARYQYCGSVGPLSPAPATIGALQTIGRVLANGFGLRGIFGVDYLLRAGVPWPVEINPRYTASVEVLELAGGVSALAAHGRAFDPSIELPQTRAPLRQVEVIGKAILFAKAPVSFPAGLRSSSNDPWKMPEFADIPAAGEQIQIGQPILTFFTQAPTIDGCTGRLRQIAAGLDRQLFDR